MTYSEKAKILIVDDEVDIRESVTELFEMSGYQCFSAGSVPEAQKFGSFDQFDIVITDISMPGGMGTELITAIRQHRVVKPSIIVMTGYSAERLESLFRMGANAVFKKPFAMWDMVNCVNALLSSSAMGMRRDPRTNSHCSHFQMQTLSDPIFISKGCELVNISKLGMCGQSQGFDLEPDTPVSIALTSNHLPDPDNPLVLNAVVKWVSAGKSSESRMNFGIEFGDMSDQTADQLFVLINTLRTNTKQKVS